MPNIGQPRKHFVDIGETVGDLTCIDQKYKETKSGSKELFCVMKCNKCEREKEMKPSTIRKGHGITHHACGQFEKTEDPDFHRTWCAMRTRTTNPNYEHYKDYGGRGISSEAFKEFIDFKDAMYTSYVEKKKELGGVNPSLERIDVNGDYCPENCEWIALKDQKSNMRKSVTFEVTFPDGHKEVHRNVSKFARETNLNASCIRDKITGKLKTYKGYDFKRVNNNNECND